MKSVYVVLAYRYSPIYITHPTLIAAAEREACAKVCEYYFSYGARDIADAIRARSNP
jgi:hypothetical protein